LRQKPTLFLAQRAAENGGFRDSHGAAVVFPPKDIIASTAGKAGFFLLDPDA